MTHVRTPVSDDINCQITDKWKGYVKDVNLTTLNPGLHPSYRESFYQLCGSSDWGEHQLYIEDLDSRWDRPVSDTAESGLKIPLL